jgi:hypothetical protein
VLERIGVDAHELLSQPDARSRLAESEWRGLVRDAMRLIRGGIEASAPQQAGLGSNGSHDDDVDTHLRPVARPNIEWRASQDGG